MTYMWWLIILIAKKLSTDSSLYYTEVSSASAGLSNEVQREREGKEREGERDSSSTEQQNKRGE